MTNELTTEQAKVQLATAVAQDIRRQGKIGPTVLPFFEGEDGFLLLSQPATDGSAVMHTIASVGCMPQVKEQIIARPTLLDLATPEGITVRQVAEENPKSKAFLHSLVQRDSAFSLVMGAVKTGAVTKEVRIALGQIMGDTPAMGTPY